jgi:hypothetical protein
MCILFHDVSLIFNPHVNCNEICDERQLIIYRAKNQTIAHFQSNYLRMYFLFMVQLQSKFRFTFEKLIFLQKINYVYQAFEKISLTFLHPLHIPLSPFD